MVSTSVQASLLQDEANILLAEANRQIKVAVREREEVLAKGGEDYAIRAIAPSTVATQIIRAALPGLEAKIEKDKKGRSKK